METFPRLPASMEHLRAGTIPPPDQPLTPSQLSDINAIPVSQLMVAHSSLGEEQIDPTSITKLYKSHTSSLLPSIFTGNPSSSTASPILNLPTELLTTIFTSHVPITSLIYLRLVHPRFKAIIESLQTYRLLTTHAPHLLHLSLITNLGTHSHFTLSRFHHLLFGNPDCYNCGINYTSPSERLQRIQQLSHHTQPFYGDEQSIFDLLLRSSFGDEPEQTIIYSATKHPFSSLKTESSYRFPLHLRLDFPNLRRTCCAPSYFQPPNPALPQTLASLKQSRLTAQTLLTSSELCLTKTTSEPDFAGKNVPFVSYPPGLEQGPGGLDTWLVEWERQLCTGQKLYRYSDLREARLVEEGCIGLYNPGRTVVDGADEDEEEERSTDVRERDWVLELVSARINQRAQRFGVTMPILVPSDGKGGGEEVVRPVACKGCLFFDFVARSIDGVTPLFPPRSLVRPEWEVREHVRECPYVVELVRTATRALRRRNGEIDEEYEIPASELGMIDYELEWGSDGADKNELPTATEWGRRRNRKVESSAEIILGWLEKIEEDGMSMDDIERLVMTMRMLDWAEHAEKGVVEESDEGVFIKELKKQEPIDKGGLVYDGGLEDEQFSWLYGGEDV